MTGEQEIGCAVALVIFFVVSHIVNTVMTNSYTREAFQKEAVAKKAATYEVEGDKLVFKWK